MKQELFFYQQSSQFTSRDKARKLNTNTSKMKTSPLLFLLLNAAFLTTSGQPGQALPQQNLAHWPGIPTGNYSGITPLGNSRYAVVSDKAADDGFFIFHIEQDSLSGQITNVRFEGFSGEAPQQRDAWGNTTRDCEGVAFLPRRNTIWISGEGDQAILEYDLSGRSTGRKLDVPSQFSTTAIYPNRGFEALCHDTLHHCFWTTTESSLRSDGPRPGRGFPRADNRLRLLSFDDETGKLRAQYAYRTDSGSVTCFGRAYIFGVPALSSLPDGRLLVMEREGHFPQHRLGSRVSVKFYAVDLDTAQPLDSLPSLSTIAPHLFVRKTLLASWTTHFNLFARNLANYEGVCLGHSTADGRPTLICINDSQARMGNALFRLKDFLRVVVLSQQ